MIQLVYFQVCEPVLSDEILDLNNVSSGEFSVHKVSQAPFINNFLITFLR